MKPETKQTIQRIYSRAICYLWQQSFVSVAFFVTIYVVTSLWRGIWNNPVALLVLLRGVALALAFGAFGTVALALFAVFCWMIAQTDEGEKK